MCIIAIQTQKIRSGTTEQKLHRLGDSDGLCVEINLIGKKYWRYRFQWLEKTQMMSLGEVPYCGIS